MNPFVLSFAVLTLLSLIFAITALPWAILLDPRGSRDFARKSINWVYGLGGVVVLGLILAGVTSVLSDQVLLQKWGRFVGVILHLQVVVSVTAVVFPILLLLWPHGGAVALAAFREAVRQPMFWLIAAIATFFMLISIIIPFFTFGEDVKMVRELGFDAIWAATVVFSVLAASMSITEEIEGRTAITVMSKPVSRRQFLVGKFLGIFMAAFLMTGLLSWVFDIVLYVKPLVEGEKIGDPYWLFAFQRNAENSLGGGTVSFLAGIGLWFQLLLDSLPGLAFGLCKTMVLLSIAVALATRLPMIVSIMTCVVIYFLGHLSGILASVSEGKIKLVNFIAKTFQTFLPGLDYFDASNLIAKDVPSPPGALWSYVGFVALYAVLCSVIALLLGLILFEDRDLA